MSNLSWLPLLGLIPTAEVVETAPLAAWFLPLLLITLLILANGLFVAAEFAIIGVRASQLQELAQNGQELAKDVLSIVENPAEQDRYIATAQLGITIASLGLGMYAEPAVAHLLEPHLLNWFNISDPITLHTISYILVLSVLTYLHVVIGEMVPKSVALTHAASTALLVNYPMRLIQRVLMPLVRLLNGVGAWLLRRLDLPPPPTRIHSPEEIEQIVFESAAVGLINQSEWEIIHKIFDFGDRQVGQVMTPRTKVQALAVEMSYTEVQKQVTASNHNRFPVYDGSRDNIIGMLHLRDLVTYCLHQPVDNESFDLRHVINPAPAVPEDTPVDELLATFKRDRIHMAIVLDEFGGLAGIVTLEDLVEEVVGEVRDEFDVEREPLVQIGPGKIEMAGSYLVDDLQELVYLGEKESLPNVDTVNGLIVTELGRPPQVGDKCIYGVGAQFTVLAVDGLTVSRTLLEYPVPDDDQEGG